ncbi:hypothetical protein EOL96_09520, partial [Candidatus Saccharibacteria bacterium]|nr:hypothetical protein [Candidatus Saccharibacteria bacterium]
MSERNQPRHEGYPAIELGRPLPGLKQAWELKEVGINYEDQAIPTAHGVLRYFPVQLRDGTITWAVEADEETDMVFCVTVESGTG